MLCYYMMFRVEQDVNKVNKGKTKTNYNIPMQTEILQKQGQHQHQSDQKDIYEDEFRNDNMLEISKKLFAQDKTVTIQLLKKKVRYRPSK